MCVYYFTSIPPRVWNILNILYPEVSGRAIPTNVYPQLNSMWAVKTSREIQYTNKDFKVVTILRLDHLGGKKVNILKLTIQQAQAPPSIFNSRDCIIFNCILYYSVLCTKTVSFYSLCFYCIKLLIAGSKKTTNENQFQLHLVQ